MLSDLTSLFLGAVALMLDDHVKFAVRIFTVFNCNSHPVFSTVAGNYTARSNAR